MIRKRPGVRFSRGLKRNREIAHFSPVMLQIVLIRRLVASNLELARWIGTRRGIDRATVRWLSDDGPAEPGLVEVRQDAMDEVSFRSRLAAQVGWAILWRFSECIPTVRSSRFGSQISRSFADPSASVSTCRPASGRLDSAHREIAAGCVAVFALIPREIAHSPGVG